MEWPCGGYASPRRSELPFLPANVQGDVRLRRGGGAGRVCHRAAARRRDVGVRLPMGRLQSRTSREGGDDGTCRRQGNLLRVRQQEEVHGVRRYRETHGRRTRHRQPHVEPSATLRVQPQRRIPRNRRKPRCARMRHTASGHVIRQPFRVARLLVRSGASARAGGGGRGDRPFRDAGQPRPTTLPHPASSSRRVSGKCSKRPARRPASRASD